MSNIDRGEGEERAFQSYICYVANIRCTKEQITRNYSLLLVAASESPCPEITKTLKPCSKLYNAASFERLSSSPEQLGNITFITS